MENNDIPRCQETGRFLNDAVDSTIPHGFPTEALVKAEVRTDGIDGVQLVFRWGKHGISAVDGAMLHAFPFAWEFAAVQFPGDNDDFSLDYSTDIIGGDVAVFGTLAEAIETLARFATWAKGQEE